jgi:hypothetical protein
VGVKTPFLTTRGFAPQILLGGKNSVFEGGGEV